MFAKLQEKKVRYLVVGGLAVNLHGIPRMTADVDIAIAFDSANVAALLEALAELDYKPRAPIQAEKLADSEQRHRWQKEKNMRSFTFINRVNPLEELDVLLRPPFDFERAYKRREVFKAGEIEISVAAIDDLVAAKSDTGRKQDESDIKALKLVKKIRGQGGAR